MVGVDAVAALDGAADRHVRVPRSEAEAEDLLLVLAALDEVDELLGRGRFVLVDPLGVEHVEGVVGVERALLRVDRHERHVRLAGLLALLEDAVGVARVVVDDRLLLDGHRRHVLVRVAALVGAVPVVEERQRRVAVVHHGRLDLPRELVGARLGQVLHRESLGLAVGGVGLPDERRQPAGREVRVGLAELERTPLRVAVSGPAGRVLGQGEDVGEAERLLGPSERLRHRAGHGDHERGELERTRSRWPWPARSGRRGAR